MIRKFYNMILIDMLRCFRIRYTGSKDGVFSVAIGFDDCGCLPVKLIKRIGIANGE
jgi:hypothetical protein